MELLQSMIKVVVAAFEVPHTQEYGLEFANKVDALDLSEEVLKALITVYKKINIKKKRYDVLHCFGSR